MLTGRQRALRALEATLRSRLRPLLQSRHGRGYVARKSITHILHRLANVRLSRPFIPRVRLAELDQRFAGTVVQELEPGGRVSLAMPPEVPPLADRTFAEASPVDIPPATAACIPGGRVIGSDGWISPDGHALLDGAPVYWQADHSIESGLEKAVSRLAGPAVGLPGTTVSLLAPGSSYYHWLLDMAPRAALVREFVASEDVDHFLIPPQSAPFVGETLDLLGIERSRRVEVDAEVWHCERLVATAATNDRGFPHRCTVEALRRLFGVLDHASGSTRLYVKRDDAAGRRVVNEDEVVAMLERYGFEALTMTGRTVRDQAARFASADVVVAPSGAALANLVFAPRSTGLLELMPANYLRTEHFMLARAREMTYDALVGSEPAALRALRHRLWRADLIVDVAALETKVVRMLLRERHATHR